ncbi:hypothetical protein IDZ78_09620, partial [Francisella tularensis subsp. holarctica]|uniref:NAD(P)H-hydrate dehydratase n=1 Tax=Francisella tularensis TaxID=263 RepID=UPI00167F7D58
NTTGNQGMAVAGQGDVLSGIIGAFLAQGLDILSASRLAVYIQLIYLLIEYLNLELRRLQ